MTPELKQMIAAVSTDALLQLLNKHTVAIYDEDTHDVSSGTLVRILDKVLIITASHNIPTSPSERLQILPDRPREKTKGILRPGRSSKNHDVDVGFLEINSDVIDEYFVNKQCCTLKQLKINGNGDPSQLTVIAGCPIQFVQVNETQQGPPFSAQLIVFASTPLSTEKWPSKFEGRNPDISTDILFEFPSEGCSRVDTNEKIQMDTPKGFSGGGIWAAGFRQGEIWSADDARQIGIQVSWDSKQRIVKATQIIHWINLVRCKVPELTEHLESEFPELANIDESNKETTSSGQEGN